MVTNVPGAILVRSVFTFDPRLAGSERPRFPKTSSSYL